MSSSLKSFFFSTQGNCLLASRENLDIGYLPESLSLMSSHKHVYEQLDPTLSEIRLLVVEAGSSHDQIKCRTKVISLTSGSQSQYETISYCWGDATKRSTIFLNEVEVDIPASSCAALVRVRLQNGPRVVWIDAVCVNQIDLDERSTQVSLMTQVYSKAQGNLIYLGEDPHDIAADTIALLGVVCDKVGIAVDNSDSGQENVDWLKYWTLPQHWKRSPPLRFEEISALGPLYGLPWFKRLWVVQEAILAQQNVCLWGNSKFALDPVLRLARVIIYSEIYLDWAGDIYDGMLCTQTRASFRALWAVRDATALATIFPLSSFQVTDIRDSVFALTALITITTRDIKDMNQAALKYLEPDYRKAVPEVLRDATRGMLMMGQFWILEMTSSKTSPSYDQRSCVSWTAPWGQSSRQFHGPYRAGLAPGHERYTWQLNVLPTQSDDPNILTIKGYSIGDIADCPLIGAIHNMLTSFRNDSARALAQSVIAAIEEYYSSSHSYLPGDSDAETKAFQTAAVLLSAGKHDHHDLQAFLDEPWDPRSLDGGLEGRALLANDFHMAFRTCISHRMLFRTTDGEFGVGPLSVRAGDKLVVFPGLELCSTLRPMGGEYEGKYEYLGPAYVPCFDKGEVFEMGLEQHLFMLR